MSEGTAPPKQLVWIGSSKKDLKALPQEVVHVFGYALYLAQIGQKHEQAKPLRGFGSAGVLEVRNRDAESGFGSGQEQVESSRQARKGAGG